jgi:hypothetical protein
LGWIALAACTSTSTTPPHSPPINDAVAPTVGDTSHDDTGKDDAEGSGTDDAAATDAAAEPTEPSGVWMRGDLHLHSSHSLDALDNPVDVLVALAEARGMDFFVLTDHDNHVNGEITTWFDPLYTSDSMVVLLWR